MGTVSLVPRAVDLVDVPVAAGLAAGELVTDQLPSTPSRKDRLDGRTRANEG